MLAVAVLLTLVERTNNAKCRINNAELKVKGVRSKAFNHKIHEKSRNVGAGFHARPSTKHYKGSKAMNDNSRNGIGFFGLLTIVFVILRLTEVITWSWWWVLAPLWIPMALSTIVVVIVFLVIGLVLKKSITNFFMWKNN